MDRKIRNLILFYKIGVSHHHKQLFANSIRALAQCVRYDRFDFNNVLCRRGNLSNEVQTFSERHAQSRTIMSTLSKFIENPILSK